MVRGLVCMAALLGAVAVVTAGDRPALPKGGPPVVAIAQASEKDGAVVIRFAIPEEQPAGAEAVADPTGKTAGVIVPRRKMGWAETDVTVDGRAVRAMTADGNAIDPKDLPRRLAKASRVVVFRGQAEPDPFYLGVYREDTVVFVGPADKFKAPAPKK